MINHLLVTGGNGFIGKNLCYSLVQKNHVVRSAVRRADVSGRSSIKAEEVIIGNIGPDTNWQDALKDVDVVIHLAARVHVLKETAADSMSEFRKTNVAGTEHLAKEAAFKGVKRFIYISSIGVNGNKTKGCCFSEESAINPYDSYTLSKWEAEQILQQIAKDTGLELVILRPPLVYGPSAPGNFARLISLVQSGLPLPLGSVKNIRSFIYIKNLVDAIVTCITHPDAAGKTFLVSDGQDISTSNLIKMIASAMGKRPRLLPFPPALLKVMGWFSGKSAEMQRLAGSLCIDSSRIRKVLGWNPPFTVEEGIYETVKWYRSIKANS